LKGQYDFTIIYKNLKPEPIPPSVFDGNYAYKVELPADTYKVNDILYGSPWPEHELVISPNFVIYLVNAKTPAQKNIISSGTIYRKDDGKGSFLVTTEPYNVGDHVSFTVGTAGGPVTYIGKCSAYSSPSEWSFTAEQADGSIIHTYTGNLYSNGYYLQVIYTGYWQNGASEGGEVTHIHDAYGIITLEQQDKPTPTTETPPPTTPPPTVPPTTTPTEPPTEPPTESSPAPSSPSVLGESDKSPAPSVLGETEKLPQTGGISASTIIGIAGLTLIAAGGVIFVIANRSRRYT
jgi:LPXTG-motif cell wall-anchored protein